MIRAALLDVDGVLVDSEQMYCRAVNETFGPYDVQLSGEEYVERYFLDPNRGTRSVVEDWELQDNLGLTVEETTQRLRAEKAEIVERMIEESLEMMPGARNLLDRLERFYAPIHLGAVSSAGEREVHAKLRKFDLLRYFEVLVTASHVTKKKPDPESYEMGFSLMAKRVPGLQKAQTFVVEDNPSGVLSARRAGLKTMAFPNGFTDNRRYPDMARRWAEADPDRYVRSLDKINEEMLIGL